MNTQEMWQAQPAIVNKALIDKKASCKKDNCQYVDPDQRGNPYKCKHFWDLYASYAWEVEKLYIEWRDK